MADVHNPDSRSKNMRAIGSKNTRPELLLRQLLFARGFRFRIHANNLPGKPDIILPKHNLAVFVHGCFWHGHDCYLFKLPQTRTGFWLKKIGENKRRDRDHIDELQQIGWRVLVVWECALKGRKKWDVAKLGDALSTWIRYSNNGRWATEVRHAVIED